MVSVSMMETGKYSGIKSSEDTFRKDNWITSSKASNWILASSSVIVKSIITSADWVISVSYSEIVNRKAIKYFYRTIDELGFFIGQLLLDYTISK